MSPSADPRTRLPGNGSVASMGSGDEPNLFRHVLHVHHRAWCRTKRHVSDPAIAVGVLAAPRSIDGASGAVVTQASSLRRPTPPTTRVQGGKLAMQLAQVHGTRLFFEDELPVWPPRLLLGMGTQKMSIERLVVYDSIRSLRRYREASGEGG